LCGAINEKKVWYDTTSWLNLVVL